MSGVEKLTASTSVVSCVPSRRPCTSAAANRPRYASANGLRCHWAKNDPSATPVVPLTSWGNVRVHPARRRFARGIVRPRIGRRGQLLRPGFSQVGRDRVRVEERLDHRHRRLAVDRRGHPSVHRGAEPRDRVAAVSGEHDRAAILERQRDDARLPLRAHHVGEGRHLQPVGAVSRRRGRAVLHVRDPRILVAQHLLPGVAIPPGVLEDPVRVRERAGGDGGVAGARDGRQVGIGGLRKRRRPPRACASAHPSTRARTGRRNRPASDRRR